MKTKKVDSDNDDERHYQSILAQDAGNHRPENVISEEKNNTSFISLSTHNAGTSLRVLCEMATISAINDKSLQFFPLGLGRARSRLGGKRRRDKWREWAA